MSAEYLGTFPWEKVTIFFSVINENKLLIQNELVFSLSVIENRFSSQMTGKRLVLEIKKSVRGLNVLQVWNCAHPKYYIFLDLVISS